MYIKPTRAPGAGESPPQRGWRRSALVPTVATVLGIALFVTAGNWQRGRMVQKEALRAQYDAAGAAAPAPLPATADWEAQRYRQVELRGRYDAARQILLDNRVHQGRAGYHVVTPLVLPDRRAVLVDRGWIAAGPTRREIPLAPPPAGEVVVVGRIALPVEGLRLGRDAPAGPVWQHLDPARFAEATGLAVVPVVVLQATEGAPSDGLVRDWPEPDFGIDKHRIYMVQWYLFALMAAALWVWFVARPRMLGRSS